MRDRTTNTAVDIEAAVGLGVLPAPHDHRAPAVDEGWEAAPPKAQRCLPRYAPCVYTALLAATSVHYIHCARALHAWQPEEGAAWYADRRAYALCVSLGLAMLWTKHLLDLGRRCLSAAPQGAPSDASATAPKGPPSGESTCKSTELAALVDPEVEEEEEDEDEDADEEEAGEFPQPNFPEWSWEHVRDWCAIRRITRYSDEQIAELAQEDIVMLEKTTGVEEYGTIEEGTLQLARRIKAVNPDCKTLFYLNAMVHYVGPYFQYAAYADFKDEWLMVDQTTGERIKWNVHYDSYDHSNLEFREWWIQNALDMVQHDEIDGIFIDAITKADVRWLPVQNHAQHYRASADELKLRLPAGKIMIGNALRFGKGRPYGADHLEYLDGSYLEQWYSPDAEPENLMGTLNIISQALQQDKIIMLKTEPIISADFNASTLDSLSSVEERYLYIDEPRFINFTLAYFLLIVEPYAYYSYRTGVDANPYRKNCFDNTKMVEVLRSLGAPVSGHVQVKTDQYSREFERVIVHVNLRTHQGALTLKGEDGTIIPREAPVPDPPRVTIAGDWQHDNGRPVGSYFSFDIPEWSDVFGRDVTQGSFYHAVEQWRDGRIVWTGDVMVWPPTATTASPHGRTEPWLAGQFRDGDLLSPRPPRVSATSADWVHDNGRAAGSYFAFNLSNWSEVFGVDVTSDGTLYTNVDLWRHGEKIWTGDVKVWLANTKTTTPHGRTEPFIESKFENWDQLSPASGSNRQVCLSKG